MMYADINDYCDICDDKTPDYEVEAALKRASSDVDILTYNRIQSRGFGSLTPFQQKTVKEAVCYMAQFRIDYGEIIDTPYQTYSINGVSMETGKTDTITVKCGVMLPTGAYEKLISTGLCCGVL